MNAQSLNFYKIKRGDIISWGQLILQSDLIIWSPLLYFNFKVWRSQILGHSLDFNVYVWFRSTFLRGFKLLKIKDCVRYLSLSLKDKCFSSLFRTKYIEKKFNLLLFFLSILSWTFTLAWATKGFPLSLNFLIWKMNCMSNRDNAHDVDISQMKKSIRQVNRTNQVQTKKHIVKDRQTSVLHLIPRSTCYWISNRMRYSLKNIFWSKHFPATTNCRSRHSRVFLVKPVLKIS